MDFWGLFDSQNSWENRSINKLVFNNAVAWAQYELLAPRLWALGEVRQLMEKCWFYSIQIETFWRVDQNRRVRICMWESSPLMRKTRKRKAYCSTNWSHIQLMTTGCRCEAWWRQEKPEVILRKIRSQHDWSVTQLTAKVLRYACNLALVQNIITEIFSYACNLDLKYSRVYDEFIITDRNIKEDWRLVKIFLYSIALLELRACFFVE